MINCKSCCYCGYGKNVKCPFYQGNSIAYEDIRLIEKNAHTDQLASLYWAACLLYGHRTAKNQRKAVAILEKLARKDYVPAQYLLSLCYFEGIKVSQNPEKAFDLCQTAARDGCNLAEIKLYQCYRDGVGVKQDLEQAKQWCGSAAGHQSSEVYYEYAELCCLGKPGKTDLKTACTYFKRAAENGNTAAYDRLVELHKHHIEECYDGYLDPSGVFAYQEYTELGDFCLENQYAPDVRKALANYRSAKEMLLNKQKKNAEDLQSENAQSRCYAQSGIWSNLGPDIAKCQERIKKCYALILAEDPARKALYEKAAAGDTAAQIEIAGLFEDKTFALCDLTESLDWYRLAADQGNAVAQNRVGNRYFYGKGVATDYAEAVKWYRLAAEQGEAHGQNNLGCCYINGKGIETNCVKAIKWYRLAAEQGHAAAQCNLGYCYGSGRGVAQDYAEALKWYRLSADQGNANAQGSLGNCYYYGYGVDKDYTEAVKWYRLSAEQGDAYGQNGLGCCYANGYGIAKDYTEAVKWFTLAAEKGNEQAQNNLEICKKHIASLSKPRGESTAYQTYEDQSSRALDEQMRMNERHERMRQLNDITTFSNNPDEVAAARSELYGLGFYDNV